MIRFDEVEDFLLPFGKFPWTIYDIIYDIIHDIIYDIIYDIIPLCGRVFHIDWPFYGDYEFLCRQIVLKGDVFEILECSDDSAADAYVWE